MAAKHTISAVPTFARRRLRAPVGELPVSGKPMTCRSSIAVSSTLRAIQLLSGPRHNPKTGMVSDPAITTAISPAPVAGAKVPYPIVVIMVSMKKVAPAKCQLRESGVEGAPMQWLSCSSNDAPNAAALSTSSTSVWYMTATASTVAFCVASSASAKEDTAERACSATVAFLAAKRAAFASGLASAAHKASTLSTKSGGGGGDGVASRTIRTALSVGISAAVT
mmetsp:Transcript_41399/g.82983  ORF Transcript_41399/g.82983 Transcript_41399/m.82983 type:complete len:223 (+) Transcript_41399:2433-3101(+)